MVFKSTYINDYTSVNYFTGVLRLYCYLNVNVERFGRVCRSDHETCQRFPYQCIGPYLSYS